ncbi:cytochrome c oxidase assembly factor 1 homolog isoform X2 [Esox lucius]|uniref:cytochrome c oxidase assembly factor 1 homolog isoform X2 n=1 Tax=Esox lucius TaxID=8010 RepID=UPI00097349B3|nr:cytochrome c oxidase assembly factor 1 homolog isoform X2 [Esox lucius]
MRLESFSRSDYHSLALEKLKANQSAMDRLGAPPLKVHNIHLSDRYNRVEPYTAQIKIPVTGSKDGGYLYTTSVRDPQTLGWNLTQAVLQLREGQSIDLLTSTLTDKKEGLDTDNWSS